eukprot:gene30483-35500_t
MTNLVLWLLAPSEEKKGGDPLTEHGGAAGSYNASRECQRILNGNKLFTEEKPKSPCPAKAGGLRECHCGFSRTKAHRQESSKWTKPEVIEKRVEGSLQGLILAGDVSMMPGGYLAVFERYHEQGELEDLTSVEFRDVTPWEDEVANAVCELVPYTSKMEEFVMHNCGAPSMEGWVAMLRSTEGWAKLRKMVHSGDKLGSVLLGMNACYPIPAVAGLNDEALLAMAAHVVQTRPWEQLEELTLQNIVYPVLPFGEDPNAGMSVQMDGREAINELAKRVWPFLEKIDLDPIGLDGWTKMADRAMPQEA